MREVSRLWLALGLVLAAGACDPKTTDVGTGSIAIQLVVAPDGAPATAALPEGIQASPVDIAEALTHLDSAKVTITGGTYNTTTTLTRNGTTNFTGTVSGIPVASNYTVIVVGYDLNEIDYYGRTLNVAVTANQTSTATITFSNYVPAAPTGLPASPTAAFRVNATIAAVATADSYKVELASVSNFSTIAASAYIRTTTAIVTVTAPGTWYLRVRSAGSAATGGGRASNTAQWTVVTDQIATTDVAPGLNLGFFGDRTLNRDSLNIAPAGDFDFFTLSQCNGDSLIVTAQAVRLAAPGSPLNSQLHVYNASGVLVAQNDNADSTDAIVRFKLANDGQYHVRVSASSSAAAGTNVGHYRLATQGKRGSAAINNGSACVVTPLSSNSISAGLYHTCAVRGGNITDCWGNNGNGQLGDNTSGNATTSPVRTSGATALTSVVSGGFFSCGLTAGGQAYCWGSNSFGQLGDGTTQQKTVPTAVSTAVTFVAGSLTAGLNHVCGLVATGATPNAAMCWGGNAFGQLGNASTSTATTPTPVGSPSTFTSISAGRTHTCGISTNGYLYCWGEDASDQLGSGAGGSTFSSTPVVLGGLNEYTAVAAGGFHTCALRASPAGAVHCWGDGTSGQLGNNSFTSSEAAVSVATGVAFNSLTSGRFHTCGLASGVAWCWGGNANGQLGTNDAALSDQGSPVQVATAAVFTSLSAGHFHTCAIQNTGTTYCWGWNGFGQIGNAVAFNHLGPMRVSTGTTFQRVTLGHQHTCGLASNNNVMCWGLGTSGQLGLGDFADRIVPATLAGGWSSVSGGGWHTCGVPSGSTSAQCWGWGFYGQLGNGGTGDAGSPVAVSSGTPWANVSTGDYHTCAISTGNAIYCWGDDTWGQLGNGAGGASTVPSAVTPPGGVTWAAVSAGTVLSCALTSAGAAWCWGDNDFGGLGNNSTAPSTTPVPVSMPSGRTFVQIQAGQDFVCARADNGAAYCWGNNSVGQLGTGSSTTNPVSTPQLVTGGLTFIDVSASRNQGACGITNANRAYCWGGNFTGLLGDGTFQNRNSPTAVNTSVSFQRIQISDVHTCAIELGATAQAPGAMYCWGNNERGELGNNTRTSVLAPTQVIVGPSTTPPVLASPLADASQTLAGLDPQTTDQDARVKLRNRARRLHQP